MDLTCNWNNDWRCRAGAPGRYDFWYRHRWDLYKDPMTDNPQNYWPGRVKYILRPLDWKPGSGLIVDRPLPNPPKGDN